MPSDGAYLHGVQPLLEEPACSLVTKVMEVEVLDPEPAADPPECLGDTVRFESPHVPF